MFVLGACGETMPAQGHQGDPAVTERDGRKVRGLFATLPTWRVTACHTRPTSDMSPSVNLPGTVCVCVCVMCVACAATPHCPLRCMWVSLAPSHLCHHMIAMLSMVLQG